MEHVHINITTLKWDRRGKAKERPREKERILKVLLAVAPKKVVAKVIVDQLLLTVTLVLVHQVLTRVGMSTVYVDAFSMESTCRTRLEKIHLADLLQAKRTALLVKLGSRVTALLEVHAETGILETAAGMQRANVRLVVNVYSFIAVKQE